MAKNFPGDYKVSLVPKPSLLIAALVQMDLSLPLPGYYVFNQLHAPADPYVIYGWYKSRREAIRRSFRTASIVPNRRGYFICFTGRDATEAVQWYYLDFGFNVN